MAKTASKDNKKKGGNKFRFILLLIIFCIAVPFMIPTMILLTLGMIPSVVALITDNDPERSSATAIGVMNFAGITPFIIDLWLRGQTMDVLFHILRDPSNWVVILGAAAVGKMIIFAIPQAMAILTALRAESRLKLLKQNLETLKTSWGPDVATNRSPEKIVRGEP